MMQWNSIPASSLQDIAVHCIYKDLIGIYANMKVKKALNIFC